MKHFEDKRQIKSRFYSKLTVIGLSILALVIANGVWKIYQREKQSESMRFEAEARLTSLKNQKDSLTKEMNKLSSEGGVEEEIRQKFNVVKPGEHVVVIVNTDQATTTATTTSGFWASLWQKIWQ